MHKRPTLYRETYIPFLHDEDELAFERADVEQVKKLWAAGDCCRCMGETIGRDPDLILVLLVDLARSGAIEKRKNGFFGDVCSKNCRGQNMKNEGELGA